MAATHAMSNGVNGVHTSGRQAQTPAEMVSSQQLFLALDLTLPAHLVTVALCL